MEKQKNKSIVVKESTWNELQNLNHNQGRKSIEDVIKYLLDLADERNL